MVEVVSTNWETDYARKVEEYALLGIPEYWIADYRGLGGITFIGKPKQPTFTKKGWGVRGRVEYYPSPNGLLAPGFIHGEKEKICIERRSPFLTCASLFKPKRFIHGVLPSPLTPLNWMTSSLDNPTNRRKLMSLKATATIEDLYRVPDNGKAELVMRSENDYGETAQKEIAKKWVDYFEAGTLVVWDVDVLRGELIKVFRASEPRNPTVHRQGEIAEAEPAFLVSGHTTALVFDASVGRSSHGSKM